MRTGLVNWNIIQNQFLGANKLTLEKYLKDKIKSNSLGVSFTVHEKVILTSTLRKNNPTQKIKKKLNPRKNSGRNVFKCLFICTNAC